jgi:hypothetical protein
VAETSWRDRAPAMLVSPDGPDGKACSTSMDRRWLWRLEGFLAINGTSDFQRQMGSDLRQYLNETCEHHWGDWFIWERPPRLRQCMWCCDVEEEAGVSGA